MASSVVGNLIIKLSADISSFESGLRKAQKENQRQLRHIEKRVQEFQRRFKSSMKAVGVASTVAAVGLSVIIERQTEAARRTHALAQAIGTTTGQLQSFGYAFEQVGGNADKANDIIKDLQDKIGDASLNQGGELYQTLKNIGLSAKQLVNENPTQQLLDIANAISDLPKASQVNVLESVADDATLLLPLLKDNGAELRRYAQQAREFGVSLDRDQNAKLLEAGRIVQQFKGQLEGLANQITVGAAPAIKELGKTILDPQVQKGLTTLIQGFAELVGWLVKASAKFANFVSGVGRDMRHLAGITGGPIEQTQTKIQQLQEQLSALPEKPKALGGGIIDRASVRRREQLEQELEEQKRILADYKAQKEYFDKLYSDDKGDDKGNTYTPPAITPPAVTIPEQPQTIDVPERISIMTQAAKDARDLADIEAQVKTRQEQINEAYRHNVEVVERAATGDQKRQELLARLQTQHEEALARVNDQYSQMSAFAHRAAENIQDELGKTLRDTLSGSFDGILESWGNLILDMIAQAQAAQLSQALLGSSFQKNGQLGGLIGAGVSAVGSYFGGGATASVAGSIGGDAPLSLGALSGISGARAAGGSVSAGQSYLVGERGPEIATFPRSGSIIPNNRISQPSAAPTINIINNADNSKVEQRKKKDGNGVDIYEVIISNLHKAASNGDMDSVLAPYNTSRNLVVT